jgi:hypothetical protein
MADVILIKLGPMSCTPDKPYAAKAKARMQAAAEKAIRGVANVQVAPPGKPAYSVSMTLSEIVDSTKARTCKFSGVVSTPAGTAFGLNLRATSSTGITEDEEGDVLFCIDDAVPKMLLNNAVPAVKDHKAKNP